MKNENKANLSELLENVDKNLDIFFEILKNVNSPSFSDCEENEYNSHYILEEKYISDFISNLQTNLQKNPDKTLTEKQQNFLVNISDPKRFIKIISENNKNQDALIYIKTLIYLTSREKVKQKIRG